LNFAQGNFSVIAFNGGTVPIPSMLIASTVLVASIIVIVGVLFLRTKDVVHTSAAFAIETNMKDGKAAYGSIVDI